jgi:hypothetical protein
MSYSQYKQIADVLKQFQIVYTEQNFLEELAFDISKPFLEDLELTMRDGVPFSTEFAICENIIYPTLKEVWKQYRQDFVIWSHHSLNFDENLNGFPEYILAKRSSLGKLVLEQPYFLLVEAKQDKFGEGWGQCLAEMVAAQQLNQHPIIVYGIVSNGRYWEFGKLENSQFTRNLTSYGIQFVEQLCAVLNYIFKQCEAQLRALVTA